ncbi:transcription elongation factor, N-terminal family protein [Anaplasma phagocytophilum str. ApNP]|uniref:Transcription elongation factor GreA n=1 Tax=Anaplasma phagocytophilum str. ApNP TaxID=1359153 RepID=A0A0F3NEZ3_ANAPH|nr:transcription elongation factor, N-terminal family protein [Anaplasma phagocytophilum str. ApNP]
MESELEALKSERPKIIKSISDARELGDLSENAEYHAARERQGLVESKIMELESKKSRAEVIEVSELSGDTVMFGQLLLYPCMMSRVILLARLSIR